MMRRTLSISLLLASPLLACGDKGEDSPPGAETDADTDTDTDTDTDSDTDADADTDTDTDTDVPTEDCGDGLDNDGDGLVDCEDSDCLDACGEDCGDGLDNDEDGLADCADDECVGDAACTPTTGTYDLSMVTTFQKFPGYNYALYLGWGPGALEEAGQGALLSAYGTTTLFGLRQDGSGSFACTGDFYVTSYGALTVGDQGAYYLGGADGTVDYVFAVVPNEADGSLTWGSGGCPVTVPPLGEWGFYTGKHYFARRDGGGEGAWARQYSAGVSSTFYYYTDLSFIGLLYLQSLEPVTWSADYTF